MERESDNNRAFSSSSRQRARSASAAPSAASTTTLHDSPPAAGEEYRILFESNPQPMWVYDAETLAFLAVNEAAEQAYGYTREEFLSMTILDIRPAEDIPDLLKIPTLGARGPRAAHNFSRAL